VNDRAEVVVIGAGVVGASIAYQLARRTDWRIVVVERGAGIGEGSTGASSAIVRCRYTHPEVVALARDGQRAYRHWSEFTGLPDPACRMVESGVLWLLGEDRRSVVADAERLRAAGVETSVLGPEDLRERFPAVSDCGERFDLTGATDHVCRPFEAALLEERGGYADAPAAAADLAEAARLHGAEIRFRTEVTGVRTRSGRVTGVDLADGTRIDCAAVVNAAGPWCERINRLAGVELGWTLDPTRVQVIARDWPSDLGPIPVIADASSGVYFRLDANGARVLLGSILAEDEEEVVDPDRLRRGADAAFRETKIHGLHHRIPALAHRGSVTGIAGLYTINREDVHPVVGPTGLDGFWVANGFSGHGFKLAPMIGSMVAQALSGVRADFDTDVPLGFFAVDRDPIVVGQKTVLA